MNIGISANVLLMDELKKDTQMLQELAEFTGLTPFAIAKRIGVAATTINRPFNGSAKTRLSLSTLEKLKEAFPDFPKWKVSSDHFVSQSQISYVPVDILPTYAGAGGGGNGDLEPEKALIPRSLIEDILRGKPSDFILINVRGDSMEPDFRHDDQILIDRRDTSPSQPGPFALWDGEWGEYLIKNVERIGPGEVRIFSSNPKYSPKAVDSDETRIIGRPVWFGRKL